MENKDTFGCERKVTVDGYETVSGENLPEFDLRALGIKAKEYTVALSLRYGKLTLVSVSGDFKPPLFKKLPTFMGAEPEKAENGETVYKINKPSDYSGKLEAISGGKSCAMLFSNGIMISQQFTK